MQLTGWSAEAQLHAVSAKLACIEQLPHEEDVELTLVSPDASGTTRLTNTSSDEAPWPDWGRASG